MLLRLITLLPICASCVLNARSAPEPVAVPTRPSAPDFNREIRPLLSENCFACHGTDKQKSALRLDREADSRKNAESGNPAIVPGKASASELIRRVESTDHTERMPSKKDPLSKEQIALLRQWIDSGATYAKHWAYEKPERPAAPETEPGAPVLSEIDRFILQKLKEHGLEPAAKAPDDRLIRRLFLDLTGLPPTVEQVDAFTAKPDEAAYEKIVDELLASPRFGEHWARHWLDLARYADSNGFQADQLRDSYAFKNWVIQALNADMPYDRFTIEQLAGDLLPGATADQKIATGFHRTVTCNVEAGVHPEENRVNQVVDRVNTTGTVWLGTTLECAQCHNHKYDPFTQEDYYRLFAFFNNTPVEVRNKSGKGVSFDFYGPKMDLPLSGRRAQEFQQLNEQCEAMEARIAETRKAAGRNRTEWAARLRKALAEGGDWKTMEVVTFESTGGEDHQVLEDGSVLLGGSVPDTTSFRVALKTRLPQVDAVRIEALTHPSLPGDGPGRGDAERTNFILSELTGAAAGKPLVFTGAEADFSQQDWEVPKAIDGDPKTGWAIAPQFGKPHWAVFRTSEPVQGGAEGATIELVLDQNYGRGRVLGRVRFSAYTGDPAVLDLPDDVAAILGKDEVSRKDQKRLDAYYEQGNPSVKKLRTQLAQLKKKRDAIKPASTLVMVEMDAPRETHVMIRGQYLNKGKQVAYGTPGTLHPWKKAYPQNRLGLAQWLVDRDNPLTARVAVNRWWSHLVGRGIVATEEDFGSQAEPPTHPELLDWLAVELMDHGWSMKHLIKTVVMSATYRQDSRIINRAAFDKDPDNRWLSRGPRFRMTAEMIRDNALAVSGLLHHDIGGDPVFPPQPDGLWRQTGRNEPKYVVEKDEERFRRGIYVIWRRAAPYPSFVTFDGPDRSACHPTRSRTNTPLQALTLLNDEAYVEMALAFAAAVMTGRGDAGLEEQLTYAFRRALARKPARAELDEMKRLYEQEYRRFERDPKAAEILVGGIGGYRPDPKLDRKKLAAWFFVTNMLLNLDETITKG